MSDKILIEYQVNVDGLKASLKDVEKSMKDVEKVAENSSETISDGIDDANEKTKTLNQQLKELKIKLHNATDPKEIERLTKAAAQLQDKLKSTNQQINQLASGSKFQQFSNVLGGVILKIKELDFAGAAEQSKLLAGIISGISFKDVISGVKGFGTALLNIGKALLGNPLFLLAALITGVAVAAYDMVKSFIAIGEQSQVVTDALKEQEKALKSYSERIRESQIKIYEVLGIYSKVQAEQKRNEIKNSNELIAIKEKFNEDVKKIEEEFGTDGISGRLRFMRERMKLEKAAVAQIVGLSKAQNAENLALEVQGSIDRTRATQERINQMRKDSQAERDIIDAKNKEILELQKKLSIELRDLQVSLLDDGKNKELAQLINKFTDIRDAHQGQNEYLLALETKYQQERDAILKKYHEQEVAEQIKYDQIRIKNQQRLDDELDNQLEKNIQSTFDSTIAANEQQYQQDLESAQRRKTIIDDVTQFALQSLDALNSISNNITQERLNKVQENSDKEKEILDSQLRSGIISRVKYEEEIKKLDEKKRKEEAKLRKQQFENEKSISLIKIAISTAQGIANALEGDPYTVAYRVAFAALTGAAQAAVVASQPTPKFAKGVVDLKGAGTKTSDSIHAMLSKGESVITADATATDKALFEAFNKGKGQKYIYENYVMPALQEQINKFSKNKEQSFAQNIANSMMLNSGSFKDGNILDSLKMNRRAEKENFEKLIKVINKQNTNIRSIV